MENEFARMAPPFEVRLQFRFLAVVKSSTIGEGIRTELVAQRAGSDPDTGNA